jgi:hypothetical protein
MAGYISGAGDSSDIFLPESGLSQPFSSTISGDHTPHVPNKIHIIPEKAPLTKLSKGAIAGIVVGSLVAFGLVLFLIIYFTVGHSSNNGNAVFGTIQYSNSKTGDGGPFQPKDVILVKYLPRKLLNGATFSVSVDNGKNFTNIPSDPNSTNSALWTIPDTVFSDKCLFRVTDAVILKDFIQTNAFSVIPRIVLISGPGSSKLDTVQVGVNQNVKLNFDSVLSNLNVVSDWTLDFSPTQKFKSTFGGNVVSVISETSVVTWVVPTLPQVANVPYYWRLTTTSLVKAGYPEELSVESNNPVNISSSAPPQPGVLTVGLIDDKSGKAGYFVPGDPVTIRVVSDSALTGIVFVYFDGTSTLPLVPTGPGVVVDASTTDFPWVIPENIFTDNFSVTATLGSKTSTVNGIVEPEFTWDQPVGGTQVISYVAGAPSGNTIRTTVAYRGSLAFMNWEVGYVDGSGNLQPIGSAIKSGETVTIDWSVTQERLGLDPGQSGEQVNTVNYVFYVKVSNNSGQSVVTKTTSGVVWFGDYWVPVLSYVKTSKVTPSFLIASHDPPQEGDVLQFSTNALSCFSVPVNTQPQQYSYLVYIFPDDHPLPQTFNFFLIQSQGQQGPILTKNYNTKLAEITPFNRAGNPPTPYAIGVVSDSREVWDINNNTIFFNDAEFNEPHIFDFGSIMPVINIFG